MLGIPQDSVNRDFGVSSEVLDCSNPHRVAVDVGGPSCIVASMEACT